MSSSSIRACDASTSRATAEQLPFYADHYRKVENFRVQHAVHTVVVDLKTHKLYTPEQEEDGKPVARMVVYEVVGDR